MQLKADRVDPATRKLSIKYYARSGDYFRGKPHDGYWNGGRQAVGARAVYAVNYAPLKPAVGGAGSYLFDAKSHAFMWAYRGR